MSITDPIDEFATGETWAEVNAAHSRPAWVTEHYPRGDTAELAQRTWESGLIFLVNAAVLHHHGLALGVNVSEEGQVLGLTLHATDDPDGITFDEQSTVEGRAKLRAAGLLPST